MVWHFPNSVGTHLRTAIFYCISCKKSEVICSAGRQEGSAGLYLNEAQMFLVVALELFIVT